MLLKYECALLLNAINRTPVIPVMVGERAVDGKFEKFDTNKAKSSVPDIPHIREEDAQSFIDELRHVYFH